MRVRRIETWGERERERERERDGGRVGEREGERRGAEEKEEKNKGKKIETERGVPSRVRVCVRETSVCTCHRMRF